MNLQSITGSWRAKDTQLCKKVNPRCTGAFTILSTTVIDSNCHLIVELHPVFRFSLPTSRESDKVGDPGLPQLFKNSLVNAIQDILGFS